MFPTVSLESYDGPSASFPLIKERIFFPVGKSTINDGGAAHAHSRALCMYDEHCAHNRTSLCVCALLLSFCMCLTHAHTW